MDSTEQTLPPRSSAVADQDEPRRPDSVAEANDPPVVESDVLVEEISIDGMCGVY